MSKEVAVRTNAAGGILAMFEKGDNPFLDAAAGASDFFGAFLKFNGNTGDLTFGEDDKELVAGSEVLANMATAQRGWICWVDGEVVDERNFVIAEGQRFPSEDELPDHGPYEKYDDGSEDGWQEQYILHLYSEKLEQAFTFKTSSKSGVRSVRKFLKAYGSKAPQKIGKDGQLQVPLVEIEVTDFILKNNKKAGKKYAPVFNIVEWVEFSEVADLFENSADNGEDADDYDDDAADQAGDDAAERSERSPRRGADKEEAEERPSRRSRAEAPAEEAPRSRRGRTEEAPAEEAEPEGRRSRVRHAPPQDAEADATTEETRAATGRDSARGRRGRTRD